MPFVQHHRDDVRRRVRLMATSPLTMAEVVEQLERLVEEGAWQYGWVVDIRRAIVAPSEREALIKRIEELSAAHGGHGPMALVTNQVAGIASAQLYAIQRGSSTVQVFWDLDEANRWLDRFAPPE